MKALNLALIILAVLVFSASHVSAGEFDSLISSLNVQAEANIGDFKVNLGATFGAPVPLVDMVIGSVASPGEAYLIFNVAEVSNKPVDVVIAEYKKNKGKGWGVIAKNLGIKPGSKEFHALKNNKMASGSPEKVKGKGKDKR